MTSFPDLFAALAAPFRPEEVKVRQEKTRSYHYVTARTIMNRLDSVVGPENWTDSFSAGGESSVLCSITLRLPDGRCVTKSDAGGSAGMADSGDDDKSMHSDAFKRAAVKFGVSRYLYRDGVASFDSAPVATSLPAPAPVPVPVQVQGHGHADASSGNGDHRNGSGDHNHNNNNNRTHVNVKPSGTPMSGKALWVWCKDAEKLHEIAIVKYLTGWAKLQEFPGRMLDWDPNQVRDGYLEALRKIDLMRSDVNGGSGR